MRPRHKCFPTAFSQPPEIFSSGTSCARGGFSFKCSYWIFFTLELVQEKLQELQFVPPLLWWLVEVPDLSCFPQFAGVEVINEASWVSFSPTLQLNMTDEPKEPGWCHAAWLMTAHPDQPSTVPSSPLAPLSTSQPHEEMPWVDKDEGNLHAKPCSAAGLLCEHHQQGNLWSFFQQRGSYTGWIKAVWLPLKVPWKNVFLFAELQLKSPLSPHPTKGDNALSFLSRGDGEESH